MGGTLCFTLLLLIAFGSQNIQCAVVRNKEVPGRLEGTTPNRTRVSRTEASASSTPKQYHFSPAAPQAHIRYAVNAKIKKLKTALSATLGNLQSFGVMILLPKRSIESQYAEFVKHQTREVIRRRKNLRSVSAIFKQMLSSRAPLNATASFGAAGNRTSGPSEAISETNRTVRPEISESGEYEDDADMGFREMSPEAEDLIRGIQVKSQVEQNSGDEQGEDTSSGQASEEEEDDDENDTEEESSTGVDAEDTERAEQEEHISKEGATVESNRDTTVLTTPKTDSLESDDVGQQLPEGGQDSAHDFPASTTRAPPLPGQGSLSAESAQPKNGDATSIASVVENIPKPSPAPGANKLETSGAAGSTGTVTATRETESEVRQKDSSPSRSSGTNASAGTESKTVSGKELGGEVAEASGTAAEESNSGNEYSASSADQVASTKRKPDPHGYLGSKIGMLNGENTTQLSLMVYKIAKSEKPFSMAAAPCRTVRSWMPEVVMRLEVELHGFQFYCVDTDEPAGSMDELKGAFGELSGGYLQTEPEAIDKALPKSVELVVSWMGMQSWGVRKSWRFIKGLRRSGARMALFSNNPKSSNAGASDGTINVRKSPLLFNEPQRVIGKVSDDDNLQLLLYSMDGLRDGF